MNNKCIGCGISLQDVDINLDGYVSHNDYRLCERCFKIKNYGQNKVINVTNDDYLKILDSIHKDDLVVYVTSMLTLNVDFLNKFKNVILVITKRDIMPKSIKNEKIISYVSTKFNIKEVIVLSALKKFN